MKIGPLNNPGKNKRKSARGDESNDVQTFAKTSPAKGSRHLKRHSRKKKRLKYITFLPSFITLLNGACGFMAIIFASRSMPGWSLTFIRRSYMTSLSLAGFMVLLAMIADVLDGRIARLTRTTSSFGGQLDSLSDAISFGAAPAFLMAKVVESHLETLRLESVNFSILAGRLIFFSAILYAMCALVRLARFNVENEENEAAHMNFAGLPSPAAAGVVVSLVILHEQLVQRIADNASGMFQNFEILTITALPGITLLAGILMVSRIRYPHLANYLLRGKKSPAMLLAIFAAAFLVIWNIQLALVIGFCGFALFGIVRWIVTGIFRKRLLRPHAQSETGR